ncbi:hypothetical protein [Bosea sp. ANAM02]|uniref:hypothetical protein n=1 Tax=Bosea sp. ANAM02 TaxID=2020412 RepID=UPI00140F08F6|nr:hypothetical protein [Bosea sp. ANAM02]BCB22150.1 hypothetical protein OCUBac02_50440 [Bosea sp. ANAM02]
MKNLMRGTALATLLASCILLAPGAQAQTSTFIAATCGGGCSDPLGEEAAARSNWTTLTALGTTQYVGASFNGGTIDASSLLAASRVAGPVVLDTYLRTGQAPDPATAQAILNALGITGIDVSGITGVSQSGNNNDPYGTGSNTNGSSPGDNSSSMLTQLANVLAGNTNGQFGSAGNASNVACDESIASATVAAAQQHINNMVTIATSGDYGFSQNGGSAVSSGQRSQSGYFGSSCLDSLMQGNRDLLFRPPQLSQLLSQLQNMFGGGGSGGSSGGSGSSGNSGGSGSSGGSGNCANAPAILQQVMASMPSSIFSGKGNGGFFPHLGFGGGEGTSTMNAFGLTSNVSRASTSSTGGIATLFSR